MQNGGPGDYARNNLRDCRCGAPKLVTKLSQPNVNFGDGFGNSVLTAVILTLILN